MSDWRSTWERLRRRFGAPRLKPFSVPGLLAELGLADGAAETRSWLDDTVVVLLSRPSDEPDPIQHRWQASVRVVQPEEYLVYRGSGTVVPSAGGRVGLSARWVDAHDSTSEMRFHHVWPSTRTRARLVDRAIGDARLRWRRTWPSTLNVRSGGVDLATARRGPAWSRWSSWPTPFGEAVMVHGGRDGTPWGRVFHCPTRDGNAVVVERASCPDQLARTLVLAAAFEVHHRWWWTSTHFYGGG